MGPISLFDKSFLQALTLNEACLFDHFFLSVLCPIFITEVLADLAKPGKQGTPDPRVVGALAEKAPCLRSYPSMFHKELIRHELMGGKIDMSGRPHVGGGHFARSPKGLHIAHDESPEMIAFARWQSGRFEEVEREFAANWRAALELVDLKAIKTELESATYNLGTIRNLDDARLTAAQLVAPPTNQWAILKTIASSASIGPATLDRIKARWAKMGRPSIKDFAPYSTFVLEVDIFFELAILKSMIGDSRPSNRIDISYLYYLPFCQVFVSRDKLHRRTAPLFMRPNQQFVWGDDLKSGLAAIHTQLIELPSEIRETGLIKFANCPPVEISGKVHELWDSFIPNWRKEKAPPALDPEKEAKLLAELKKGTNAPRIPRNRVSPKHYKTEPQSMHFSRSIPIKRGDWFVLPKGIDKKEGGA